MFRDVLPCSGVAHFEQAMQCTGMETNVKSRTTRRSSQREKLAGVFSSAENALHLLNQSLHCPRLSSTSCSEQHQAQRLHFAGLVKVCQNIIHVRKHHFNEQALEIVSEVFLFQIRSIICHRGILSCMHKSLQRRDVHVGPTSTPVEPCRIRVPQPRCSFVRHPTRGIQVGPELAVQLPRRTVRTFPSI